MIIEFFKLIWKNLGTLFLALFLAVVVWVSAVVASDPNQEKDYPYEINLEIIGQDDRLVMVADIPNNIFLKLIAPVSVWDELSLNRKLVSASIDISGLDIGSYELPVDVSLGIEPVRVVEISPSLIKFTVEKLVKEELAVIAMVAGEPALGYQLDKLSLSEGLVQISGAGSIIAQVRQVVAEIDVTDARGNVSKSVELIALDNNGNLLEDVDIFPSVILLEQEITQAEGYKNVAVRVETIGQQASGYRVTSISAFPQTVTVSSSDPNLVNQMPGFVRTQPIDLTNADDDIEVNLVLELPEGVVLESEEQFIFVQVGIAPIETSISLNIPIEFTNLNSGLSATSSPAEVDLLISGPVPILDELSNEDIVIVVDLTDLGVGTHLLIPNIVTIPDSVLIDAINPETIEVEINLSTNGSNLHSYNQNQ
ncbi:MAG: hypothetical protein HON98_12960 [Chloroflexi bacterium]|jgi:YbbR domain-containing protein|nr:hypothetical protein [Chloroflexota bacterium]MBT4003336.1 hypothetical protein [Chloroflexota bacterium]MBT4305868.1 hypothetical protein [Chloroflexota bacterium]MBT4533693.1 hypothetical protein [Chloroflexota bacterium]MBT4681664.1 hypothetical protein [Chloroflexota bacterium]